MNSILYSAPWVLPISQPPISSGAVLVRGERILAVGSADELRDEVDKSCHISCDGVLMPGLVNSHIHLELSHLTGVPRPDEDQTMADWIDALLQQRLSYGDHGMEEALVKEKCRQHDQGCILLGDIGNARKRSEGKSVPEILEFLEFLGANQESTQTALANLAKAGDLFSVTAHAPYSTSPELLTALKAASKSNGTLFSIHLAESPEESDFIVHGRGSFRQFLNGRKLWDGTFPDAGFGGEGVVEYLDHNGILDESTLCVHCVHLSESELDTLKQRKASVCICPGSNRFLRVGKRPLELMLKKGILPGIGTDSMASNETLDMWREMRIIREEHPTVKGSSILAMATLGGAQALHSETCGSLERGKKSTFLNISLEEAREINDGEALCDRLIQSTRQENVTWLGP